MCLSPLPSSLSLWVCVRVCNCTWNFYHILPSLREHLVVVGFPLRPQRVESKTTVDGQGRVKDNCIRNRLEGSHTVSGVDPTLRQLPSWTQ